MIGRDEDRLIMIVREVDRLDMIVMEEDRLIKRRNVMRFMQMMVSIYNRQRPQCRLRRRVKSLVIRKKGCTW